MTVQVFPNVSEWPSNILRIQIRTDRPFEARGGFAILDEQGRDLEAFADFPEGLWSPCGRFRTLLLHPGRVKRGLASSANGFFDEGGRYQLVHSGQPAHPVCHFTAGPPVREPVKPSKWIVRWPARRSMVPVTLETEEILDFLSVAAHLHISSGGRRLSADLSQQGRRIQLHAKEPWPKNHPLHLSMDPRMEDICGNRIGSRFETKAQSPVAPSLSEEPILI